MKCWMKVFLTDLVEENLSCRVTCGASHPQEITD